MSLKSGHRIIAVVGDEDVKQQENFVARRSGTIRLQPEGWFFPVAFSAFADKIYDFKFKPTDVLIMTYPKCGTTWAQEIVWTMLNNPNFDNPNAKKQINARCPFLEYDFIIPKESLVPGNNVFDLFVQTCPEGKLEDGIFLQVAELSEEPRIMKTHLSFPLLTPSLLDTCKVIYLARNPKDVAVSYCHHARLMKTTSFIGTLSEYVDHFVNDTLLYSPFWIHLKEAWTKRHHPNLLYLLYEDLKDDPTREIFRIQKFLGTNLTRKQIDDVQAYTTFESMKERESKVVSGPKAVFMYNEDALKKEGGFLRKGEVGDWKNKLTEEDIKKIDDWTFENTKDMEDDFKYKIK